MLDNLNNYHITMSISSISSSSNIYQSALQSRVAKPSDNDADDGGAQAAQSTGGTASAQSAGAKAIGSLLNSQA
jgi:hypothetical protein